MTPIKRLEFRCPNCKTWFHAPFGIGEAEYFHASTIRENYQTCAACGVVVPCNKENFRFAHADGKGGWVGSEI